MKKISTLFKKDFNDLGRVINEINPENDWVIEGLGIATRKFDGTACSIIKGELYKRYDAKTNKKTGVKKQIPKGAIPCQDPDLITGHHPHWIKCHKNDNSDKWHFIAFNELEKKEDGTYELCGEKIRGNPEKINGHKLIKHGSTPLFIAVLTFEDIKSFLQKNDIEGIIFKHKKDDRMCKIRKTDFKIQRGSTQTK